MCQNFCHNKIITKNGSKKRDRRNLKFDTSFSEAAIEENDDNFGNLADEIKEKNDVVEGVRSKETKKLMSWELAGTNQIDIQYRNNEDIENEEGK